MEIIVHIIKDINRYTDLGIYLLVDPQRLILLSLTTGLPLLEIPSADTLTLYTMMVELKRLITSYELYCSQGRQNMAASIRGQISMAYQFDIAKHYKLKKYGCF